jgi:hypothetical protein
MKKAICLFVFLLVSLPAFGQQLTGNAVIVQPTKTTTGTFTLEYVPFMGLFSFEQLSATIIPDDQDVVLIRPEYDRCELTEYKAENALRIVVGDSVVMLYVKNGDLSAVVDGWVSDETRMMTMLYAITHRDYSNTVEIRVTRLPK